MHSDGHSNQPAAGVADASLTELEAGAEGIDIVALQAEVEKWQERVPKLAAALRERSDELAAVRDELRRARTHTETGSGVGDSTDVRLKARDELIAELQQKVDDLGTQHRDAASELHATQLDLQRATEEAQGWRSKWHTVTSSLDTSVADASRSSSEFEQARLDWDEKERTLARTHETAIQRTHRTAESLKSRNANLQETVDFANKQIASLGEDMATLVQQAKDSESALKQAADQVEQLQQQLAEEARRYHSAMQAANHEQTQLSAQLESKDETIDQLQSQRTDEQAAKLALDAELQQARLAADEINEQLAAAESVRDAAQTRASSEANVAAEQVQSLQSALQAAQDQCLELQQANNAQAAGLAELRAEHESMTSREQDLRNELQAARQNSEREGEALAAEVERLTECVAHAQTNQEQGRDERRDLAARVETLSQENARLETSVDERSALVRELESELDQNGRSEAEASANIQRITAELTQAEHKLETFQEHARTLEAKLQTQQGLMGELENELADAQAQFQASAKAAEQARRERDQQQRISEERVTRLQHKCDDLSTRNGTLLEQANERSQIIDELNARIAETGIANDEGLTQRELEQVLRERTEELDALRWRLEQSEATADENVVMVLNQQLTDAHDENKRLREKIANAPVAQTQPSSIDDLTEIKGIGAKLVEQLTLSGINTFAQIADLELTVLDAADHPLYALRNRVQRDDWIKQAKQLVKARR